MLKWSHMKQSERRLQLRMSYAPGASESVPLKELRQVSMDWARSLVRRATTLTESNFILCPTLERKPTVCVEGIET